MQQRRKLNVEEKKLLPLDIEHRQADPINRDGALFDQIVGFPRSNLESVQARITLRLDRGDPPDPIDVARNHVAAEQLFEREAALEIHAIAGR